MKIRLMVKIAAVAFTAVGISFLFQNCAATSFSEVPEQLDQSLSAGTPISCGSHAQGEVWEALDGSMTMTSPVCAGAVQVLERFTTYECVDGVGVETSSRPGQQISSTESECQNNPSPQPTPSQRSCQGQAHGSTLWQTDGQEQVLKASCSDGTKLYDLFQKQREVRCMDGTLVPTGQTRQGSLISAAGQCPTVQPTTCPGGYTDGQLKTVNEGTLTSNVACPSGQSGSIQNTYTKVVTYRCANGAFSKVSEAQGALQFSNNACVSAPRPPHCTESYTKAMCDIYDYLFGRWPDKVGAEFWVADLNKRQLPQKCWHREVSKGTKGSDCNAHFRKFGVYPHSGSCSQSPKGWSPSAIVSGCP